MSNLCSFSNMKQVPGTCFIKNTKHTSYLIQNSGPRPMQLVVVKAVAAAVMAATSTFSKISQKRFLFMIHLPSA